MNVKVFQETMGFVVRETKRQYRILRISTGYDTSARITDEVLLLNWIPHFPVQLLNKLRIGRRWKNRWCNLEIKFGFTRLEKKVSTQP